MPLPYVMLSVYFGLGLIFTLVVLLRETNKRGVGPRQEPIVFGLYFLLWPIVGVFWLFSDRTKPKS